MGATMTILVSGFRNMKSRVKGDFHARFCGKARVKFHCLTRLDEIVMDIATKLKTDYPGLIVQRRLFKPEGFETHEEIQFNLLLNKLIPGQDKFVSKEIVNKILKQIDDKFNNGIASSDKSYFESHGTLKNISISELKFYQLTVGIEGRQHSAPDKPVYVIKHNSLLILRDGYHRTLLKIMTDKNLIDAYVLEIYI